MSNPALLFLNMKCCLEYSQYISNKQIMNKGILYFSAPWCGPCKVMSPLLEQMGKKGQVKVKKINIDYEASLPAEYNIKNIPTIIKELYKISWDLSMKDVIDQAADRAIYVCQSQSLNLWIKNPDTNKLSSMHMYSWKKGLKTGIYYLRRRAVSKAQQFSIDPEQNDECLMCGS